MTRHSTQFGVHLPVRVISDGRQPGVPARAQLLEEIADAAAAHGFSSLWITDHLLRNEPAGPAAFGYPGWQGPYLDRLSPDPWGNRYVMTVYPLFMNDERDAVLVSAGPNGRFDSSYASALDAQPIGDDLVLVLWDKSIETSQPPYGAPEESP